MITNTLGRDWTVHSPVDLVTEECCNCGVLFAMPKGLRRRFLDDHNLWFYCPNGHRQHYTGQTDAEREKARADRLAVTLTHTRDQLNAERRELEYERRSKAAVKGHLTRLRNRIAAGVCPCCRRNFANVRAHISTQHPDWASDHAEALNP
jgi:hypothetical protein